MGSETLASATGFTLKRAAARDQYGEPGIFSLSAARQGGQAVAQVRVKAADLRMALLELHYDETQMHPTACESAPWPGVPHEGLIEMAVLSEPGVVYYGAVIPWPQRTTGVSGEFTLLRISFDDGPALAAHQTLAAPTAASSMIPDLVVDPVGDTVSFSYYNNGDYDQNSEVNIADITPLGQLFGTVNTATGPGPFNPLQWESVVDGDSNGEINIGDITPIGANFFNDVQSYSLYGGDSADYPASPGAGNGAATLVTSVDYDSAAGNSAVDRLQFQFSEPIGLERYFWVRPVGTDGTGGEVEGIASNMYDTAGGGGGDTTPPVWTNAIAEGVIDVIPRDGEAEVIFGEAKDAASPPVTYRVYYAIGDSVIYNSAIYVDYAAPPEGGGASTTITGLTNGTQYSFAVRALDSATPAPNEESNTIQMTATPDVAQEMPSSIDTDTTFATPMTISTGNTCTVTNGADLTFESDLVIDGTLLAQDGDMCIDVDGDLTVNGTISQDLPDDPLPPGVDDTGELCIIARGNVDFGPSSVLTGEGNIYLVDDPAEVLAPADAVTETDTDTDPADWPFNWMPDDTSGFAKQGASFAPTRQVSSHTVFYGPPRVWLVRGNWGKVPIPRPGVTRIVLRIRQRHGEIQFQDWNIEGPDGRPGAAVSGGCDVTGEDGKDNPWRMLIQTTRRLVFNNVTIKFGDGGRGGDATTDPDCCPGLATGGKGGKPNNKFRFSAGSEIQILGTFNLNPGLGGRGGDATSFGKDGLPGCPGEDGCDATSTGGAGGDAPKWGIAVRGNVGGIGNLQIGILTGGRGGNGTATAGDGGDGTPCCDGGMGGVATATGGKGGNAEYNDTSTGAAGGGAQGGDGGDAFTFGGNGGRGGDCFKLPAGNGGQGGNATSTGGDGGLGTGGGATADGLQGTADAWGGNGGDGGNGCPPGTGGAGGTATATGSLTNTGDGLPGTAGVEWPAGCIWIWCIPITGMVPDPLIPGPIPDGFSGSAQLLDADTLTPVGTVPFHFYSEPGTMISWTYDAPTETPTLIFQNAPASGHSGIVFDLLNVNLLDPTLFGGYTGASASFFDARNLGIGGVGSQVIYDTEMVQLDLQPITPVTYVPAAPPTQQDFPYVDSFFDIFYKIEFEPNTVVSCPTFYFWDP